MPTLVVDAGDLLAPYRDVLTMEKQQRIIKADLILETLAKTGIDAMTPGRADFAFGVDYLTRSAAAWGLPYLCANLVQSDTREPLFPATRIVQVGDVSVGIVGLIGKGYVAPGLEVTDPIDAARRSIAELQNRGARIIVVLSNQNARDNDTLARRVKGIDIIVAGSSHRRLDPPAGDQDTILVEPGSKGKYLGVLELFVVDPGQGFHDLGAARRRQERADTFRRRAVAVQARLKRTTNPREEKRLRHQIELYEKEIQKAEQAASPGKPANGYVDRLIPLSKDIPDDPEVAALVDRTLDRLHHGHQPSSTPADDEKPPVPGAFVGAEGCATCHAMEYRRWKRTRHARAYQALVDAHRSLDYECYGCHVTGHDLPGGPTSPRAVGFLKNVQCEVCHGPGGKHAADPRGAPMNQTIDEPLCRTCHTPEQTGDRFDYRVYLPRVDHSASNHAVPALERGDVDEQGDRRGGFH